MCSISSIWKKVLGAGQRCKKPDFDRRVWHQKEHRDVMSCGGGGGGGGGGGSENIPDMTMGSPRLLACELVQLLNQKFKVLHLP